MGLRRTMSRVCFSFHSVFVLATALRLTDAERHSSIAGMQALTRLRPERDTSNKSLLPYCRMAKGLSWTIVLPTYSMALAYPCTSAGICYLQCRLPGCNLLQIAWGSFPRALRLAY